VAPVSRIDKIIGLFCKRALSKRRYSAKETYDFIDCTECSHPIWCYVPIAHISSTCPYIQHTCVAVCCSVLQCVAVCCSGEESDTTFIMSIVTHSSHTYHTHVTHIWHPSLMIHTYHTHTTHIPHTCHIHVLVRAYSTFYVGWLPLVASLKL